MKNILFVCLDNSAISQIAQAFAIKHGKNKVRAYSAGTKSSPKINKWAIDAMREIGYNLSIHETQTLNHLFEVKFEYAITMGYPSTCLFVETKYREDWDVPDPNNPEQSEASELIFLIEQKVKELIEKVETASV